VKAGNHFSRPWATEAADAEWKIKMENNMKHSMITDQVSINPGKLSSGQEPINMQRRTLFGGALAALLSAPGRVMAQEKTPKDPFVLLLNGLYQPVVNAPDLGFSKVEVDLNDGSFVTTQIFPVNVEGIPCDANENTPIGKFYVQFGPPGFAVYELLGGAIAMQFIPNCAAFPNATPDGLGGFFLNGTLELTILEATGIFRSFEHGHNHMVDRLHQLANGSFDEYCFCFISRHGAS
jgi:hypothetical protein